MVISKHNDELVGIKLKFDGGYESPFLGGVCNANLVEKEVNFNGSPLLKISSRIFDAEHVCNLSIENEAGA